MLNMFKLKESFFGFYVIVCMAIGLIFVLIQAGITLDTYFGNKEYASQTQKVEYVIQKDGKTFHKSYELKVFLNEDGEVYRTDLSTNGEVIK